MLFDPYAFFGPMVRSLDPETAHDMTLFWLRNGVVETMYATRRPDPAILATEVFGLRFANPVGLAAGFDKNAEVPDAMLGLGMGFTEVGTVTPLPQIGNPRPRIFRLLPDQGVINRLGFNNEGMDAAARRLKERLAKPTDHPAPVGVNIGANKDARDRIGDYLTGFRTLYELGDYFTVNVSSPNTPGLRDLQKREPLEDLIDRLLAERALRVAKGQKRRPILLKIAPDLDREGLEEIAVLALDKKIDGMIVSNTTIAERGTLRSVYAREAGGLSGQPLFRLSTERLKTVYKITKGRMPLVGVGGVGSGAQAYEKIRSGASLVQLYTALIFRGPRIIAEIKAELAECLARDGFASVAEAVGTGA